LHPFLLLGCVALSVTCLVRLLRAYAAARNSGNGESRDVGGYLLMNLPLTFLYFGWTAWEWWHVLCSGGSEPDPAVALRSIDVGNGLSPLAMMASVFFAYALWALFQLHRVTMIETREVKLIFDESTIQGRTRHWVQEFNMLQDELHTVIDYLRQKNPLLLPIGVAVGLCILLRVNVALRGIDVDSLRLWSMWWGLGMLVLLLTVSFQQMWKLWNGLREVLNGLNATPLRDTFAKLPKDISSMRIWRIGMARYSLAIQKLTLAKLEAVASAPELAMSAAAATGVETTIALQPVFADEPTEIQKQLDEARHTLHAIEHKDCGITREKLRNVRETLNSRLNETAQLLDPTAARDHHAAGSPLAIYAALRYLALIQYALLQIRSMVVLQVFGYACMVVCVSTYPFQGRQTLSMLLTFMFFGLLGILGLLFAQIDGDPVLGCLEKKESVGSVSYVAVLGRIIAVGGVPMMAVLTSQFPSFADFFSTWLRPVSEALK
jgi:hypothetical protein